MGGWIAQMIILMEKLPEILMVLFTWLQRVGGEESMSSHLTFEHKALNVCFH